ncbi:MAG: polysaccharide biosynthesis protein [candidate division KSB1 bacterium]|nr:polysaccharide biosynthesis protein [candidate division KSB1 bacterium]MDZ7341282.1 polysaccharide biosynthesis protein [candidate division KSB1 bacterium]
MAKRLFDVTLAAIGLVLTLPILLLCAIIIKLTSKGPVFFRQERIGKGGKSFHILKFRTMVSDAENRGPKITAKNDSRITPIGGILRWTKLDELPQLINVLIGDMSFVGPRPEVPAIVKYYTEEQRQVLSVKPGIIGANQILARNESDLYPDGIEDTETYYIKHILPEKLTVDLDYVKQSSFRYDIKLLLHGIITTVLGAAQARVFTEAKIPAFLLPADMILICLAYFLAYALRFDWKIPLEDLKILGLSLPIVLITRTTVFLLYRIYKHIWKYVSVNDLFMIAKACTLGSVIYLVLMFFLGIRVFSRSVFLIDWLLVMLFVGGLRIFLRIMTERISIRERLENIHVARRNIVIIGAGDVGEMALRELERNVKYRYTMVGFIDDDPLKIGKLIHGVPVLGPIRDLENLAKLHRIDEAFLAISRLSSAEVRTIVRSCENAGIKCRIVPAVIDVLNGKIHLHKIRDLDISDLFGRKAVELDLSAIKHLVSGKRILITGAGGSIGSELSRQIAEYHPGQMILIDRNENYLHEIQCELESQFKTLPMVFYIADITIHSKMQKIFAANCPEIIFHAAAQKHVPLSEDNPDEAVKNNIFGTRNLVKLAHKYRTEDFVMVSTDKAVYPTSVMGVTKRIAEKYIQSFSRHSQTRFVIVRFGNVMNSNGSVVPMFIKQIERGGPVTVTHPEIERFFMSIPEAVQLILQAVTMGRSGEIFILEMGEPVKILDLATELIKRAGLIPNKDIKIEFTGLRPGEKLYEELIGNGEQVLMTPHKQLNILRSDEITKLSELEQQLEELGRLAKIMDLEQIKLKLADIVPEYRKKSTKNASTINIHSEEEAMQSEVAAQPNSSVTEKTSNSTVETQYVKAAYI